MATARPQPRSVPKEAVPAHYFDDEDEDEDEEDRLPIIGRFDATPKPTSTVTAAQSARRLKNRSALFWGNTLSGLNTTTPLSTIPHVSGDNDNSKVNDPPSSNFKPDPRRNDDDDTPPPLEPAAKASSSPVFPPNKPTPPAPRLTAKPSTTPLSGQDTRSDSPMNVDEPPVSSSAYTNPPASNKRQTQGASSLYWLFHNSSNTPRFNPKPIPGSFSDDVSDVDAENSEPEPKSKPTPTQIQNDTVKRLSELAAQRRKEAQQAAQQQRQPKATTSATNGRDPKRKQEESDLALKQDFEQALDELETAREERDRLAKDKLQLERQLALMKRQIGDFSSVIGTHEKEKTGLRKQVKKLTQVIKTEYEQPIVLRDRLDQAHYKLRKAERRNRYVDDTDRWKADAKYKKKKQDNGALLFGFPTYEADEHKEDVLKERRGAQGLITKSVTEVTSMMDLFNHSVFQTAASLSKHILMKGIQHATVSTGTADRARKVLGARAVHNVVAKLPELTTLNPLLTQIILQLFLVFWCNSIIEAWYPKQATFAEFLVDVCSKIKVGQNQNICGTKTMITQTHTRDSVNLFGDWAQDMLDDLHEILSVFGWAIDGYHVHSVGRRGPDDVHDSLIALIKEAYDLRTAMAEISTSGDVDLAIISGDTPFNSTFMENEFADKRNARRKASVVKEDDSDDESGLVQRVVGTTRIGLQREVMKPHLSGLMKRDIDMVLKPHVVLEQSLDEAFNII